MKKSSKINTTTVRSYINRWERCGIKHQMWLTSKQVQELEKFFKLTKEQKTAFNKSVIPFAKGTKNEKWLYTIEYRED